MQLFSNAPKDYIIRVFVPLLPSIRAEETNNTTGTQPSNLELARSHYEKKKKKKMQLFSNAPKDSIIRVFVPLLPSIRAEETNNTTGTQPSTLEPARSHSKKSALPFEPSNARKLAKKHKKRYTIVKDKLEKVQVLVFCFIEVWTSTPALMAVFAYLIFGSEVQSQITYETQLETTYTILITQ